MNARVVLTTLPAGANATEFAAKLVESRVAACVNIMRDVTSVYRWEERTQFEPEMLLVIKTTEECVDALYDAVRATHPYEVPEFVVLDAKVHGPYGAWLADSTSGS